MTKLPKGALKVIHFIPRAIRENENRARATIGAPRRLMPVVVVKTKTATIEGFGLRIKGEVRVGYDVTRFPLEYQYGHPSDRLWIETNDAVEIADKVGEFDEPATNEDQNPNV